MPFDGRWRSTRRALALVALWSAFAALSATVADAQPAPSASASASAAPAPSATAPPPPPAVPDDVASLRERAQQIRDFLDEKLDLALEPRDLFEVDLQDARAVAVEAARLESLLEAVTVAEAQATGIERIRKLMKAIEAADPKAPVLADLKRALEEAGAAPVPSATATATAPTKPPIRPPAAPSATATATATATTTPPPAPPPDPADDTLFKARIDLDRARFAFLKLPAEKRGALLKRHRERQEQSRSAQNRKALSEAEKAKRKADSDKERTLAKMRATKDAAQRLALEEQARLLGIDSTYSAYKGELTKGLQVEDEFDNRLLEWLRPTDEALDKSFADRPGEQRFDAIYDEVVANLEETRKALSAALDDLPSEPELPEVGKDRLEELKVDVERDEVDELRSKLPPVRQKLLEQANELRWRRARSRLRAMEQLDERRRKLLPHISDDKRAELSGFNATAVKQARTELAQVGLLLRYHWHETRRFVAEVGTSEEAGDSLLVAVITAFKWLLPIGLFVWWRRRAEETLTRWRESAEEAATKQRIPGRMTSVERVLAFLQRVRQPLEWLLLVWGVLYFLPDGATELLEVQLVATSLTWAFSGWLAVLAMDALLSAEVAGQRRTVLQTAELRLRTLRFLGRVVVAFGLVLALTNQLVGHGTIYSWAVKLLWFSIVPVVAVVVRWWREVIFRNIEAQRPQGPFVRWVAGSRQGVGGFIAAAAGGAYLLSQGGIRFARQYLGNLDLVKRGLAYWFRREVARQAEKQGEQRDGEPLSKEIYDALAPTHEPPELVASVADEQIDDIVKNVERPEGGVYAVVGERGAGKSTLLERIHERSPESFVVVCPPDGITGFRAAIRAAFDLPADASDEALREACDASQRSILIDDAHHLVRPVVDGLDEMDRLLELSRHSSGRVTWVYAFDNVIWQFLRRAREVRPLFDDIVQLKPWTEDGIVRLLESRSEAAGVEADFGAMVSDLPDDADSFQTEEALRRAERRYYRLLWDYSLGNPAVSLHFWRASLRRDPSSGEDRPQHFVRLFEPPPTADLERLPDSTVFVLRAVVQLDLAGVDDIVEATMLGRGQVEDALRYILARRYVEREDGRYRLRWTWYRAITRFLARRHLMMGPYT